MIFLKQRGLARVRTKVVEMLAGTAQPLTGQPLTDPADRFWAGEPAQ